MAELTREFFQKQGARGGKMGGALSWAGLTAEEKSARARHAVAQRKWHKVKPADEAAKKSAKPAAKKAKPARAKAAATAPKAAKKAPRAGSRSRV